jgi:hypothetical protein
MWLISDRTNHYTAEMPSIAAKTSYPPPASDLHPPYLVDLR